MPLNVPQTTADYRRPPQTTLEIPQTSSKCLLMYRRPPQTTLEILQTSSKCLLMYRRPPQTTLEIPQTSSKCLLMYPRLPQTSYRNGLISTADHLSLFIGATCIWQLGLNTLWSLSPGGTAGRRLKK